MAKQSSALKAAPPPVAAPAVHVPPRANRTVVVGCKVPNGLALQLCRSRDVRVPIKGGGVEVVQEWQKDGEIVTVRGPAYPNGALPKGYVVKRPVIVGGYAITRNVPADFWERWLEQNRDTEVVTSKMIIALPTLESVQAEAKENAARTSGLEPMSQDRDPRMAVPLDPNVKPVERASEMDDREGGGRAAIPQYEDTE